MMIENICQDKQRLGDLELITLFKEGMREAATILFLRQYAFLEHLSHNTVYLPRTELDDKRGIVYLAFVEALAQYCGRNGASLRTYLKKCIKNDLLDAKRRMQRQKRKGELKTVSLYSASVSAAVDDVLFHTWLNQSRERRSQ